MPAPRKDPDKKFTGKNISLPPWLWREIEEFRVREGLYSTSEAVRVLLLKAGLKEK